jgi:hypothetical protein
MDDDSSRISRCLEASAAEILWQSSRSSRLSQGQRRLAAWLEHPAPKLRDRGSAVDPPPILSSSSIRIVGRTSSNVPVSTRIEGAQVILVVRHRDRSRRGPRSSKTGGAPPLVRPSPGPHARR